MTASSYFTVLGLPDLMVNTAAEGGASSQASASLGIQNLETEEPSEFWRSISVASDAKYQPFTYIFGLIDDPGSPFPWNGVGVVAHNLWRSTARYRVLARSDISGSATLGVGTKMPFTPLVPTGESGKTNLTGSYLDVDDPVLTSPDGNWLVPTNTALPWAINLDFNTPAAAPRWGIGGTSNSSSGRPYQAFWVYAKCSSNAPLSSAPVLRIDFYDGVGVLESAEKVISNSAGQWVYMEFGGGVTSNTGAGVQCQLSCPGGTGPGGLFSISVGAVQWHCESVEVTGDAAFVYDSAWCDLGATLSNTNSLTSGFVGVAGMSSFLHQCPADAPDTTQYVTVWFREDHCPSFNAAHEISTWPIRPPGYIQAGKLVLGDCWSPTKPPTAEAALIGVHDMSTVNYTMGGQKFGIAGPRPRTATVTLPWLSSEEAMFLFDRWIRRRGVLGPVLVSINPGNSVEAEPLTMYCTLESVETPVAATLNKTYNRSITLVLREKL